MQHPLLYLGFMGFESVEEARVRHWLALHEQQACAQAGTTDQEHPIWRVADCQEADALLVCGSSRQQGYASGVQLKQATHKLGGPLGVQLDEIKLPFALSHPQAMELFGIDTACYPEFDPWHDASLLKAVQYFEGVLRPLRSLYSIAWELTQRKHEMDVDHTYHLEFGGSLDAIVDVPGSRLLLRPGVRPADVENAAWLRRPRSANFAPAEFLECSFEELAWVYAQRCPSIVLPARYYTKPIHLRRSPRVRVSMLCPRHATLLDHMSEGAMTLAQLQKTLPGQANSLDRDVYALYLTRAITTREPQKDSHVATQAKATQA